MGAAEKGLLDDWYVNHASFWLDIKIILRTVFSVVFGDSRRGAPVPAFRALANRWAELANLLARRARVEGDLGQYAPATRREKPGPGR